MWYASSLFEGCYFSIQNYFNLVATRWFTIFMLKKYFQLVAIRWDVAFLLKNYLHLVTTKWFNGFLFDVIFDWWPYDL
jgi:hypothetical protein